MPVNDYDKISRAFEKTVIKLRDNLQYLANEGKVSDRFLTIQNLIIKTLINYQHQIEALLSDLEWENTELLLSQSKQGQQLRENIEALESICIIHGVTDFPRWFHMGTQGLIQEAVCLQKQDMITLPCELVEKIEKLPEAEKKTIRDILFRKNN